MRQSSLSSSSSRALSPSPSFTSSEDTPTPRHRKALRAVQSALGIVVDTLVVLYVARHTLRQARLEADGANWRPVISALTGRHTEEGSARMYVDHAPGSMGAAEDTMRLGTGSPQRGFYTALLGPPSSEPITRRTPRSRDTRLPMPYNVVGGRSSRQGTEDPSASHA